MFLKMERKKTYSHLEILAFYLIAFYECSVFLGTPYEETHIDERKCENTHGNRDKVKGTEGKNILKKEK